MNTAVMIKDVEANKIEIDHDSARMLNAEHDRRFQPANRAEQISCHGEMTLSPVARRVKSVMVAAALLLSVPAVSFASVDFTQDQIVSQSGNTYSVQHGDSVWHGIERDELTDAQINSYNDRVGAELEQTNRDRTTSQVEALNGAQLEQANRQRTNDQSIAKADAQMNAIDHPVRATDEYGAKLTRANQQRTEAQAVALADAREEDKSHPLAQTTASNIHHSVSNPTTATSTVDTSAATSTAQVDNHGPAQATGNNSVSTNSTSTSTVSGDSLTQTTAQVDHSTTVTGASVDSTSISDNSTMNVNVSSLPSDTKVNATINGHTISTTAGALASITAGLQVQKPFNSPFGSTHRQSNGGRSYGGSDHAAGGSGNGGSNAQNSRSAGGLADSHVGGGKQGGGFHY